MQRRQPHKFRFQILHQWLIENYSPTTALDIGGGNGLLAYLLNQSGWQTTVVDPAIDRQVVWKYKDLVSGKQIKLTPEMRNSVPHIESGFTRDMAHPVNLLIGLHAHGSNMAIIQAARDFKKDFVILPCCVIDEPIEKRPGINWLNSLIEYADSLGLNPKTTSLPFVGQSTVIYTQNHLLK